MLRKSSILASLKCWFLLMHMFTFYINIHSAMSSLQKKKTEKKMIEASQDLPVEKRHEMDTPSK